MSRGSACSGSDNGMSERGLLHVFDHSADVGYVACG
jgi:hypothetical protein